MQISYERLYFQASNRPQHRFKRLHQGCKHVRSTYENHISRHQVYGLQTAATWPSMTPSSLKQGGGSRDILLVLWLLGLGVVGPGIYFTGPPARSGGG